MPARILLLALALTALAGGAHAAYLFDWSSTEHVVFVPDAADAAFPEVDILTGVWWGMDNDYMYFRMDLDDPPNNANAGDLYGMYVDERSLGVSGGPGIFIPGELDSIVDYALVATWNQIGSDFIAVNKTVWNGSSWGITTLPVADFQHSENEGSTLEWRIALGDFNVYEHPNPVFYGAVLDVGGGPTQTWDVTDGGVTPEPTTLALLGIGLAGLVARRRRRS